MAEMTPKSIFEEMLPEKLKANPQIAKDIAAVVAFEISGPTGGSWTLDLTKEDGWVQSGIQGTPKMTVSCTDADLVKIIKKELNANVAAMSQKLKFKPMDMGFAMKLGKLF